MTDQKAILEQIKENKWLNGYYDMKNGDVFAMVTDKEYLNEIHVRDDIKKLFHSLKEYTGIYRYKNIIFANHYFKDSLFTEQHNSKIINCC
jgi:hypothetical protein